MKKLSIFISLLFFALIIQAQQIKIETQFPEKFEKGKEAVVNVLIYKSDMSGFAQYKQILPEGIKAIPQKNFGGEFSVKNQVLELTWNNLPATDTLLIVSYKIKADSLNQDFSLYGAFFYQTNNKRGAIKSEVKKYSFSEGKTLTSTPVKTPEVPETDGKNEKLEKLENFLFDE